MNARTTIAFLTIATLCACTPVPTPDPIAVTSPCDGKPVIAAANSSERVNIPETSPYISIEMPANDQWDDIVPLPPKEERIAFGTPRWTDAVNMGTTCDLVRDFDLRFEGSRPADETKRLFETEYPSPTIETLTVGGYDAVLLANVDGVCPAPRIDISGPQDNVVIRTSCAAASALSNDELVRQLKETAATIRFE